MGTGYTRNDTSNNIANGNVIDADDLDGEFNAIESAFNESTGHTHDGTSAEGAPIEVTGPNQEYVSDATALYPKTDDTYDLGKTGAEWKDLYVDGTANIDSLVADSADINGGTIDGVTLGTNSAVTEAQVDNININGNAITSTDTNGNIALTPNGTGEVDISKVDIDGGTIDDTVIGGSTPAAISGTTGQFGTSLNVDGTITSDGLTVDGATVLNNSNADVDFTVKGDNGTALFVDGETNDISFYEDTGTTPKFFWDASAESLGIGTSSPSYPLHVNGRISYSGAIGEGADTTLSSVSTTIIHAESSTWTAQAFYTGGSEAMRIDSSGNVLVGKTSVGSNNVGFQADPFGAFAATVNGGLTGVFNRQTSDGDIVQFRKDGSTVGSIGSRTSSESYISLGSSGLTGSATGNGALLPTTGGTTYVDDVVDLGFSSGRFDDIYATNGTIQTSDRNEKQDIAELDEAEKRVAVAAKGLLRKFRWKSAVEEKGDEARIHFGIIAQDLQAAFEAEGLDAGRYGMFISSTWWEAEETYTDDEGVEQTRTVTYDTAEDAPEGATERTRMGVRYPELLAFIIGAM